MVLDHRPIPNRRLLSQGVAGRIGDVLQSALPEIDAT